MFGTHFTMSGTISDWIIRMRKTPGLNTLADALHSDKRTDYQRLRESGLPTFADYTTPLGSFHSKNTHLKHFLAAHDAFIIRALPHTSELPRRYTIGVRSLDECQAFLEETVTPGTEQHYSILLTAYEPPRWSGIIVSRDEDTLIEIAEAGLDELSHGKVTPVGGHYGFHGFNHFRSMRFNTEDPEEQAVMKLALAYIQRRVYSPVYADAFPKIDFQRGYFEFVVTEGTNRIRFLDYKVNESYLA